jgi:hypothetical protein
MKKIILLMSFIVLTTIAHAFNYGSITLYQDGEWGKPLYIKTSVVYNEARQTITFSNSEYGKMVLKIYSSEMKDGVEIHYCREVNTERRFVVLITVRDNIPYVTLSTSANTMFLFGF